MPIQYLRPVNRVFNGQQYSLDPSTRTGGSNSYNWKCLLSEYADAINESSLDTSPDSIIYSEDHETWLTSYPESFAAAEFTLPALSISPDNIRIEAYVSNSYSTNQPLFISLYPSGSWSSPFTYSGTISAGAYGYVNTSFALTDDQKLDLVRSSGTLLLNIYTQGGYSVGSASLDVAQAYVYVSGESVLGETLSSTLYISGPTEVTPKTSTLFTTGPFPYFNDTSLYTYAWPPESGTTLFMEGHLAIETGMTLYTSGFYNASNSMELYVSSGIDSAVDLFLQVITPTEISGNISLFTHNFLTSDSGTPLYLSCEPPSGYFPLFIDGYYDSGVAGVDLYVGGGVGGEFLTSSYSTLYTSGNNEPRTTIPLTVFGPSSVDVVGSATLVIYNDTEKRNDLNLFLYNNVETVGSGQKLFISGDGLYNGSSVSRGYAPLYISRGNDSTSSAIQFVLAGPSGMTSGIDMVIAGANIQASSTPLSMPNVSGPINDSNDLYIHGF